MTRWERMSSTIPSYRITTTDCCSPKKILPLISSSPLLLLKQLLNPPLPHGFPGLPDVGGDGGAGARRRTEDDQKLVAFALSVELEPRAFGFGELGQDLLGARLGLFGVGLAVPDGEVDDNRRRVDGRAGIDVGDQA